MSEERKKPGLDPLGTSSGIDVGPFNVRLCGPVTDKFRDLEICGPDVEIKLRDPNEMIFDVFGAATQCTPFECGVCGPTVKICGPAIMSGDIISSVINPILERQKEIDGKIEKIMESIRNIENKIK